MAEVKKVLKALLVLLIVLVAAVAGLIGYLSLAEYRPEAVEPLEVTLTCGSCVLRNTSPHTLKLGKIFIF